MRLIADGNAIIPGIDDLRLCDDFSAAHKQTTYSTQRHTIASLRLAGSHAAA